MHLFGQCMTSPREDHCHKDEKEKSAGMDQKSHSTSADIKSTHIEVVKGENGIRRDVI